MDNVIKEVENLKQIILDSDEYKEYKKCEEVSKKIIASAIKNNVVLVDKDMTAPQVKYLISKMTFFMGARMHANFAAIYTGVPVFGTAYSYKFEGAFNANGLDGKKQTALLNNLKEDEIDNFIENIDTFYKDSVTQR